MEVGALASKDLVSKQGSSSIHGGKQNPQTYKFQ